MKAKVNQELCSGAGFCVSACPEVFELNGGTAHVRIGEIPKELQGKCAVAARSCPTEAISIED